MQFYLHYTYFYAHYNVIYLNNNKNKIDTEKIIIINRIENKIK